MSIDNLSKMFDLESKLITRIVSKMIVKEKFYGQLNSDSTVILVSKVEPSKLEAAALKLLDKTTQLNEYDSNLVDVKLDKWKRTPLKKKH